MLTQKWQLLSQNEQRLILTGSILILIISVYFYIWKPYQLRITNYQQKVQTLQTDLLWLKQIKKQIQHLKPQNSNVSQVESNQSLINIIDKSIKKNKLSDKLEVLKKTGSNKVLISFKMIEFDALIKWLIKTTKKSGVIIQSADIQKSDSRGLVFARLTLNLDR